MQFVYLHIALFTIWMLFIEKSSLPAAIDFGMFTAPEGRSNLILQVHLVAGADGALLVRFGGLHVM